MERIGHFKRLDQMQLLEECMTVVLARTFLPLTLSESEHCQIGSRFFIIGTQLQIPFEVLVRAYSVWMGLHDEFMVGALQVFEGEQLTGLYELNEAVAH